MKLRPLGALEPPMKMLRLPSGRTWNTNSVTRPTAVRTHDTTLHYKTLAPHDTSKGQTSKSVDVSDAKGSVGETNDVGVGVSGEDGLELTVAREGQGDPGLEGHVALDLPRQRIEFHPAAGGVGECVIEAEGRQGRTRHRTG